MNGKWPMVFFGVAGICVSAANVQLHKLGTTAAGVAVGIQSFKQPVYVFSTHGGVDGKGP